MAKRSMFSFYPDDFDEANQAPARKRAARQPRKAKLTPLLYKASVKSLAEVGNIRVSSSTADIDNAILERIKKCLERANHPNTPEAEAKAALHLASRIMGQYNVSQAEVLAHEPASSQANFAGQSVVSIERVDGDPCKGVRHQSYVDDICHAVRNFFDCKSYSTDRLSSVELTFYGIAENTVAAAMSFEMIYNLIAEWVRPYKGVGSKNSYLLGISTELYRMAKSEKAEEEARARKAEAEAIAERERQEATERQARLDRLAPHITPVETTPSPEPVTNDDASDDTSPHRSENDSMVSESPELGDSGFDFDDWSSDMDGDEDGDDGIEPDFKIEEDDTVDPFANLDDQIDRLIKPEPVPIKVETILIKSEPNSPSGLEQTPTHPAVEVQMDQTLKEPQEPALEIEPAWASHMQLISFRATAAKIAEEFLADKGVKLHKSSVRTNVIRDPAAYAQGKRDSKNIDVHRKRIKE